jgi:TRAP-type mannitol/chloroaromatic compound transport system permease small subunit
MSNKEEMEEILILMTMSIVKMLLIMALPLMIMEKMPLVLKEITIIRGSEEEEEEEEEK